VLSLPESVLGRRTAHIGQKWISAGQRLQRRAARRTARQARVIWQSNIAGGVLRMISPADAQTNFIITGQRRHAAAAV
jgi:hypothetical protein